VYAFLLADIDLNIQIKILKEDASFRAVAGKHSFISKFPITHGALDIYGTREIKAAANSRWLNLASLPE
jgi:hypothetical protein